MTTSAWRKSRSRGRRARPDPAQCIDLFDARGHVGKERITRGAHQRVRALEQRTQFAAQRLVAEVDAEILAVGIGAVE